MTTEVLGRRPVLSVGITSADPMNLEGATRALAESGVLALVRREGGEGPVAPFVVDEPLPIRG